MNLSDWQPLSAIESIQKYGFGADVHAENQSLGLRLIRSYGRSKFGTTKWYVMIRYENKGHQCNRRVTMFKAYTLADAIDYLNSPQTAKRIARLTEKRREELNHLGYKIGGDE